MSKNISSSFKLPPHTELAEDLDSTRRDNITVFEPAPEAQTSFSKDNSDQSDLSQIQRKDFQVKSLAVTKQESNEEQSISPFKLGDFGATKRNLDTSQVMSELDVLMTRVSTISSPMFKNNMSGLFEDEGGKGGKRGSRFPRFNLGEDYGILEEEDQSVDKMDTAKRARKPSIDKNIKNHAGIPTVITEENKESVLSEPSRPQSGQIISPVQATTTVINIPTNNNQQGNARNHDVISETAVREKVKLYLRKNIAFCLLMALACAGYLLVLTGRIRFISLFALGYLYSGYHFLEGIIGAFFIRRLDDWQKRESLLEILLTACYTLQFAWIHLRLLGVHAYGSIGSAPFIIFVVVYYLKSKSPESIQMSKIFITYFWIAQIFLICMRLDKVVDWNWGYLLIPTLFYIAVSFSYLLAYIILSILEALKVVEGPDQDRYLTRRVKFIGFIWHFLYYGSAITTLIFILCVAFGSSVEKNWDFTVNATIAHIAINSVLVFYTFFGRRSLLIFIMAYSAITNTPQQETEDPTNQKPKVNFQVEKKEGYFVMLSSTYFMPLNHNLLAKNKENMQRIKKVISRFKFPNLVTSPLTSPKLEINRPTLRSIDVMSPGNKGEGQDTSKQNTSRLREGVMRPVKFMQALTSRNTRRKRIIDAVDATGIQLNFNLSADDLDNFHRVEAVPKKQPSNSDEHLCYLCYDQIPDAVLMPCGHGGICYECALVTMKAKNECVECRAPVEVVHKIDPNPKLSNVIKSVEYSKVVLEIPKKK